MIFICSFLNLLGLNSTITNLFLFIYNIILFLIFGFKNGSKSKEKGYLAGLKIALLFLIILLLTNIFISHNIFHITTIIYYVILLLTGTFGGMLGISKANPQS